MLGFTRVVVTTWLQRYGTKPTQGHRRQGRPAPLSNLHRFDNSNHWPVEQASQTRCGQCHMKCLTRCEKCNIGLHIRCFKQYHQQ